MGGSWHSWYWGPRLLGPTYLLVSDGPSNGLLCFLLCLLAYLVIVSFPERPNQMDTKSEHFNPFFFLCAYGDGSHI